MATNRRDTDYYATLGVTTSVTSQELKRAYRRLAKQLHPDANPDPDAAARFKTVAEAYKVLSDPVSRTQYDLRRSGGLLGFPGDLSDLLREAAKRDPWIPVTKPGEPRRGKDVHAAVVVTLDDLVRNVPVPFRITGEAACAACEGTGTPSLDATHTCLHCGGTGVVTGAAGGTHTAFPDDCHRCTGRGYIIDEPCPSCGGGGVETRTREVRVSLPAGLANGTRLRVDRRGGPGRNGARSGDLYLTVTVEAHPVFTRVGSDLTLLLPIPFDVAALGGSVPVPLPADDTVWLRVPPATSNRQVFRVPGRGLPTVSGGVGDLFVTVNVELPTRNIKDAAS